MPLDIRTAIETYIGRASAPDPSTELRRVTAALGTASVVAALNREQTDVTQPLLLVQQAATASKPAYVKGALYFDTTLNKLRVGGATDWETITSV